MHEHHVYVCNDCNERFVAGLRTLRTRTIYFELSKDEILDIMYYTKLFTCHYQVLFFLKDKMKVPEISTQGIYDYVEAVDSGSSLSTPNSGNNEPFASEFLGETVIHLEKVH